MFIRTSIKLDSCYNKSSCPILKVKALINTKKIKYAVIIYFSAGVVYFFAAEPAE
jgi:hypothetical protein